MVVSNTSPLNYLIQIGAAPLLQQLHAVIHVPRAVVEELGDAAAPPAVRQWIAATPDWLIVHDVAAPVRPEWSHIHRGEAEALLLAIENQARLVIMDDLDGRLAARAAGLVVIGTLGILDAAAMCGHADFREMLKRLKATNFRASTKLVNALLERHPATGAGGPT